MYAASMAIAEPDSSGEDHMARIGPILLSVLLSAPLLVVSCGGPSKSLWNIIIACVTTRGWALA